MKISTYLLMFCLLAGLAACSDEDPLTPSDEALFPEQENSPLDDSLRILFGPYNTRVQYRFVENLLPDDWYNVTPVIDTMVLPAMKFLREMWVGSLVEASSEEFVQAHFPRMIVLIGSRALMADGQSEVLGEAEGGTLIRFTRINDFSPKDSSWVSRQLTTAFHEYAHIMHQTFNMPEEFRNVTPGVYTFNGWRVYTGDATKPIQMGMVTAYATSSVEEDFAELFAKSIVYNDKDWKFVIEDQEINGETVVPELVTAMNRGRVLIRQKYAIMKKFLLGNGLDIEKIRKAYWEKFNALRK